MQLHYHSYGQGAPLVILHGLFGSLDNWHSASRRLAPHFQVFALDQRNHGRSPHSFEMSYPAMAEDVREFLSAQGIQRAHILGHSMGGKTAMQFAANFPEQVDRLVIEDIAPRLYPPRHEQVLAGLRSLDLACHRTRLEMEETLAPWVPDRSMRQFLLKNVAHDPAGGFKWKIGLQELQAAYPSLGQPPQFGAPFTGPTLFVRGEDSDYLLAEDEDLIRQFFPTARLQTIPRAGHLPHVENPDVFVSTVVEFLHA
jgi:pimeloyl-ACP methyl ester carboxylesterase